MAEIHVKRKSSGPNWPWILLILLAVGIVGWLLLDTDDAENDMAYIQESEEVTDNEYATDDNIEYNNGQPGTDLQSAQLSNNEEVNSFINYVQDNNENIGIEHNYSSKALTELAGALSTLSDEANLQNDPDLQNLRDKADQLEKNPSSEQHANIMSEAFTSAANVIDKVQKQKFPEMEQEANDVMQAAKAIQPSELATNQKDQIKSFFNESADAVQAMSR